MLTISDMYEYFTLLGYSCDELMYGEHVNGNPYILLCARKDDNIVSLLLMLSLEYIGTYYGKDKHEYIIKKAKQLKDNPVAYDYWNLELVDKQKRHSKHPHIGKYELSIDLIEDLMKMNELF